MEIAYKLLEKDQKAHRYNQDIHDAYQELSGVYNAANFSPEGDFSERMLRLVHRISDEFAELHGADNVKYLSANEVTHLIYKHDIPKLKRELTEYLQHKRQIWILFDNLDKGWPTRGVEPTDIVILRALLDAARKIEQMLAQHHVEAHSVVFVRNDVYEHLVDRSPDRGKHGKVSLDWTDPDLLREFLRRRIVHGVMPQDEPFQKAWPQICVSHLHGEDSSEYLIERSLLRPRNLLTLLTYAKSNAVNLGHTKVTDEDIDKACRTYSADLGNDIGLEIRDVFPEAEDVLYYFIDARPILRISEIKEKLLPLSLSPEKLIQLIEMLLWFAFLGVVTSIDSEGSGVFIYDVQYDMKKLRVLAKGLKDDSVSLCIHNAFRSFLEIPK